MKSDFQKTMLIAAGLACLGIGWRLLFMLTGQSELDGDGAILGIMAQDIWFGKFYVFWPEQHYLGALQHYLYAIASLGIFTQEPIVLKLVCIFVSLVYSYTLYLMVQELFNNKVLAVIACLLSLASPAFFTEWSMNCRGAFLPTCALGHVMLIISNRICKATDESRVRALLTQLAILAGFGWYMFPMIIAFFIPIICQLLFFRSSGRSILIKHLFGNLAPLKLLVDFLIIALFALLLMRTISLTPAYNSYRLIFLLWVGLSLIILIADHFLRKNGKKQIFNLSRIFVWCAIGLSPQLIYLFFVEVIWYKAGLRFNLSYGAMLLKFMITDLVLILGPRLVKVDVFPLFIDLMLYFFALATILFSFLKPFNIRKNMLNAEQRRNFAVLLILMGFSSFLYFFSRSNGDEPRHLLPIYSALFLIFALAIYELGMQKKVAGVVLALLIVGVNAGFNFSLWQQKMVWPQYMSEEQWGLKNWLKENDIDAVYSRNYNFAYSMMFVSDRNIAFSPRIEVVRYVDGLERLKKSRKFAVVISAFGSEEYVRKKEKQDFEIKRTIIGRKAILSDIKKNGRAVSYEEFKVY